jgi:hypothetical protein
MIQNRLRKGIIISLIVFILSSFALAVKIVFDRSKEKRVSISEKLTASRELGHNSHIFRLGVEFYKIRV